jgi:hypothetical protein
LPGVVSSGPQKDPLSIVTDAASDSTIDGTFLCTEVIGRSSRCWWGYSVGPAGLEPATVGL